jgi:hypothetical protein
MCERVMCESVRVETKLQWRFQDIGDAKNMEYLPRKGKLQATNVSNKKKGQVSCK